MTEEEALKLPSTKEDRKAIVGDELLIFTLDNASDDQVERFNERLSDLLDKEGCDAITLNYDVEVSDLMVGDTHVTFIVSEDMNDKDRDVFQSLVDERVSDKFGPVIVTNCPVSWVRVLP